MLKKVIPVFVLVACFGSQLFGQKIYNKLDTAAQNNWVDSVFNSMTEAERLGQLFMVAAYSNRDEEHYKEIDEFITKYHVGGLIFFQGGPVRQARLTNRYQEKAKVPLWLAMDAEWGVGMRLDSTISFPKQMTLGAIQDDKWVYEMGVEVANQFQNLDMHMNFAPVVDVNVNPKNPVIGYRSFGENKYNVAKKGIAYMKGMQDNKVIADAKHFPGHGDTDADSHEELPVILHSQERMDSVELYPFKALMEDSLMSVMIAHLQIPAYDDRKNMPTTLSDKVTTDLLRNELKFDGLALTDAMNMQGVAKYYDPGEADVKALMAGNDVVLFPLDYPEALIQIEKAIKKNDLSRTSLDERVKKVLRAKYWVGLNKYKPISTDNLTARLNNSNAQLLNKMLYQKAMTVVDNSDALLPIFSLDSTKFGSVVFGEKDATKFTNTLDNYAKFEHHKAGKLSDILLEDLSQLDVVVVGYQGITNSPRKQHLVNSDEVEFIRKLQAKTKVIVVVFGNAYSLQYFNGVKNIICTYEDNEITQEIIPQIIFGAVKAEGKLPVTAGANFKAGMGIQTLSASRLGYGTPEEAGMDADILNGIDKIMGQAIEGKATPGGQVLVAKNGKVVFHKNYGYQTYDQEKKVTDETMYDIASITKVAATVQTLMYLQERNLIDMNEEIGTYLPELKGTDKENLKLRDILTHQAGLQPFIPFWKRTLKKGELNSELYHESPGEGFDYQLAKNLYVNPALADSMWNWVVRAPLRKLPRKKKEYNYLYSDMGYYMFFRMAERLLDKPLDVFLKEEFYSPLGLQSLTYLPREKTYYNNIAPTEEDKLFRDALVCGMVHDQGAAMVGGVAGHAGLFANAHDLAILMQMNMQMGYYGGTAFFEKATIPQFTARQFQGNRRGMGWDKPSIDIKNGPTSKFASASTFGHTGFTGTAVWADPENELIYIFLSNRTYPDATNTKLLTTDVRTRIQDLIYESIWNYKSQ